MNGYYLEDLGTHLSYHDLPGQEPAYVFLHGLGSASSADFPAIARHPTLERYRAVLVDLLGFGFSDRPTGFSHSLADHAAVVARLLEHLHLQGVCLVGHSFGGSVAIALAHARPDLVSTLVVAEPNLAPEDATLSGTIAAQSEERYLAQGHADLIAEAEGWARENPAFGTYPGTLRAADPLAMHRCSVALINAQLGEVFLGLSMPRLYVFGEQTLPHPHHQLLQDTEVRIAVIPDAGHGMVGENPGGFATALAGAIA